MEPICYVYGEPKDEAAQEWLNHQTELALACGKEIHGQHRRRCHFAVMFAVRAAAVTLWTAYGPRACWGDLDPAALRTFLSELGFSEEEITYELFDLYAFYAFLDINGHLSPQRVEAVQNRIAPYIADLVRRVLRDLESHGTVGKARCAAFERRFPDPQPRLGSCRARRV